MIIVSQDKEKIVNFNNLTQIYITQDEDENAYYIRFETVDSLYEDLGNYKAEERAKEVLGEIINIYKATEAFKVVSGRVLDSTGAVAINKGFVYEMPED